MWVPSNPSFHRTLRDETRAAPVSSTCAPGMARYFVGESPMARYCRAEGKEKGKGVVVRRGLEEAQSEAAGR